MQLNKDQALQYKSYFKNLWRYKKFNNNPEKKERTVVDILVVPNEHEKDFSVFFARYPGKTNTEIIEEFVTNHTCNLIVRFHVIKDEDDVEIVDLLIDDFTKQEKIILEDKIK